MNLIRPNKRLASFPASTLGLIVLAATLTALAGASGLVYPSPYAPLMFLGVIVAMVILAAWLSKPLLALCTTLLVVFLPDGFLAANIQSPANRWLTVTAFVIWLCYVIGTSREIKLTSTAILMGLFVVWSAVTVLWTPDLGTSSIILQAYFLRLLLFLLLIPNLIRSERDLAFLMKTLAISGWLLATASIIRVVMTGYVASSRLDVMSENENALGTQLLLYLIGVLWLAYQSPSPHRPLYRILAGVYLTATILITAMSGSRGSAISLVVTVLFFLLWKQSRPWGWAGLSIIICGLAVAPIAFSTTFDRFAATTEAAGLGGREAIWQAAWQLIQLHPWAGVGIGTAPTEAISFLRTLKSAVGHTSTAIHNPLLAIWAETGIVGLILYASVLISAVILFASRLFAEGYREVHRLGPYFPLVSSVFVGFMLSWIKGGGMEVDHTYFLMLALLIIPSHLVQPPK